MNEPRVIHFRCDDADGFQLRILQANDGDFHIGVIPHPQDILRTDTSGGHGDNPEMFNPCYLASVRIRMPMIGGGSHEKLWHMLAKLFKETRP